MRSLNAAIASVVVETNSTRAPSIQDIPLASSRDNAIFALFDLPTEIVVAIIHEMIDTVGFYRACKLRLINSESSITTKQTYADKTEFFNDVITAIQFCQSNAHLLPDQLYYPTHQNSRRAYTEILISKVNKDTSSRGTLTRAINACIDIWRGLQITLHNLPRPANHRQTCISILCTSTVNVLSMRSGVRHLSTRDQTVLESPLKGALTLASVLGDIPSIEALIDEGACVDDKSCFFGSPLGLAAEYGNVGAVKTLLKYSDHGTCHLYGAIRGGHKDIVSLHLQECYPEAPTESFRPDSDLWEERKRMLEHAASNDQPAIINILIESFPSNHRAEILRSALHCAVENQAALSVTSLLAAGVDVNRYNNGYGDALHIAASTGNLAIARLLLEHGFNDEYNSYVDSMHISAVKGYTDIVQLCLNYGADINCRFYNPLEVSNWDFWKDMTESITTNVAKRGDFHMFCFLVRKGARVDITGELGPLQRQWLDEIQEWETQFDC